MPGREKQLKVLWSWDVGSARERETVESAVELRGGKCQGERNS